MPEISIINPSFEDGWREWNGIHELKVADGWQPWWHVTDTRPEYKIAVPQVDPSRIHAGEGAQQWFTTHATHTAGVYQLIHDVPQGVALQFVAWVQAFTRDDDRDWSTSKGRYRMRIGLDPYGGMVPESGDIVWSEVLQPYDAFYHLEVSTETRSDRCSVWVWGQAEWAVKHNNAYVDSCSLSYEGDKPPEPPTPPPEPGQGVTEERVMELIGQSFGGHYKMYEKETMRKLGNSIRATWSV